MSKEKVDREESLRIFGAIIHLFIALSLIVLGGVVRPSTTFSLAPYTTLGVLSLCSAYSLVTRKAWICFNELLVIALAVWCAFSIYWSLEFVHLAEWIMLPLLAGPHVLVAVVGIGTFIWIFPHRKSLEWRFSLLELLLFVFVIPIAIWRDCIPSHIQ